MHRVYLSDEMLPDLMPRSEAEAAIAGFDSRINSLEINKADNIHTHTWASITDKPIIPSDNSAAIASLQSGKADKSTVTSLSNTVSGHVTSIAKFQASRATVAALTDVPNMPTQGGSLTVLGLTVVGFQDFQNLWNYCQQLGNRIQSIITAHRPA